MRLLAALPAAVLILSACGECGEAPPTSAPQSSGQTVSGGGGGGGGGGVIPLNPRKKKGEDFAPSAPQPSAVAAAGDVKGAAQKPSSAAAAPERPAAVTDVLPADFDKTVLKSELPVLVLYGTASCRPCAQVEFQLGGLASQYAGKVAFARLDLTAPGAYELLPSGLRRLPLPAFAFYRDGSPLNIRQGLPVAPDASAHLKKWLKTVIDGRDVRL